MVRQLRDEIVEAFGWWRISHSTSLSDAVPGRFEVTETPALSGDGSDAGGGLMSVMRGGRVRSRRSASTLSTVYGTLGERAQAAKAATKGIPEWPRTRVTWPAESPRRPNAEPAGRTPAPAELS